MKKLVSTDTLQTYRLQTLRRWNRKTFSSYPSICQSILSPNNSKSQICTLALLLYWVTKAVTLSKSDLLPRFRRHRNHPQNYRPSLVEPQKIRICHIATKSMALVFSDVYCIAQREFSSWNDTVNFQLNCKFLLHLRGTFRKNGRICDVLIMSFYLMTMRSLPKHYSFIHLF